MTSTRIRKAAEADFAAILAIVNAAAQAYRGAIPPDRWHEPYMPADELRQEIADGVVFWVAEQEGRLSGVMGIQDKGNVALVRHAYVAPTMQRSGVGTSLLRHVASLADKPILIGTWADAAWAIDFYRRNGFTFVGSSEKDRLLRTYWSIPARQIETSVVLADARWIEAQRCSTRVSRHIGAARAAVYRALLDADAIAKWKVPDGMTSHVHAFDAREGGSFRISLTYDAPTGTGKTTAHTDTYHGRFARLVPEEVVVEVIEFETTDPALLGEMTITTTLADADGGTDVLAVHEGLPSGLPPVDNETGWRMALAKLAALVETQ